VSESDFFVLNLAWDEIMQKVLNLSDENICRN
jgi:hypothetical protein